MKVKEEIKLLINKSGKDLTKELNEGYVKLQKLKFAQAFGKTKDSNEIKKTKHHIARIWTIIRQKVNKSN
ncbi:MAG: hypothetical protein ACD_58C00239G0013 [uncultured bacterium]|nr:MAG: hypothetical protein ACD_58C00239G0013 [uncultured bacterium]